MKQSRSLRLASERLAELTPAELTAASGGNEIVAVVTPTRHKLCVLEEAIAKNTFTCTLTCLCN